MLFLLIKKKKKKNAKTNYILPAYNGTDYMVYITIPKSRKVGIVRNTGSKQD